MNLIDRGPHRLLRPKDIFAARHGFARNTGRPVKKNRSFEQFRELVGAMISLIAVGGEGNVEI